MIQDNQAHCINEDISLSTFNQQDFLWRFFRLANINILSNLTVPLAGLIRVAFLGHLTVIRHLAGVSLSKVLFNYIYRSLGFLRISTTALTAQAVGREDEEAILLTALRNGLVAVGLGFAILLLHQPLQELGFALFSATPEVKFSGQAYYDGRIWAAPAILLNFFSADFGGHEPEIRSDLCPRICSISGTSVRAIDQPL